jgi:hypothetical protein
MSFTSGGEVLRVDRAPSPLAAPAVRDLRRCWGIFGGVAFTPRSLGDDLLGLDIDADNGEIVDLGGEVQLDVLVEFLGRLVN